jgi:hypothetical protein
MSESVTVTGHYSTAGQVKNAREDLVGVGIPQEKIFANEDACELKVMIPASSKPEIQEILNRHGAESISES